MAVQITPREYIGFKRPFDQPTPSTLRLHNPNHKPIVVKIKVTSPKAYCVRPNSSRIEPGETVEISVILQPMKEQPPAHAKCKDKFLICSATIPVEKENMAIADFWHELEKTNKSSISEHKLRVAYVSETEGIPEDPYEHVANWVGETTNYASPDTSRQPSAVPQTPNGPSSNGNNHNITTSSGGLGPVYPTTPVNITNIQNTHPNPEAFTTPSSEPVVRPQPPTHVSSRAAIPKAEIKPTPNAAANSAPASNQAAGLAAQITHTVEEQLSMAKAEINKLQKQIGESNLGEKAKGVAVDVKQRTEQIEGYQLTVVLAVAVAAFSVGYLYHSWG